MASDLVAGQRVEVLSGPYQGCTGKVSAAEDGQLIITVRRPGARGRAATIRDFTVDPLMSADIVLVRLVQSVAAPLKKKRHSTKQKVIYPGKIAELVQDPQWKTILPAVLRPAAFLS